MKHNTVSCRRRHSRGWLASLCCAWALATPAAADITDGVIKIGVLTDVNGGLSDVSGQGSMVAAELALEDVGGQVNNYPVQLLLGDHQNRANKAQEIAKQWHEQGVDLITDMPLSSTAVAVHAYTRETDVVTIAVGAGAETLTGEDCSPHGLHWTYSASALTLGLVEAMAAQNQTGDWFVITLDSAFGRSVVAQIEQGISAHGSKIVGTAYHSYTETDFAPHLRQALDSGAEIIAIANAGKTAVATIRHAKELGIAATDRQLVNVLTVLDDIRTVGLYASAGLRFISAYYWDQNEAARDFSARFRRRYGRVPSAEHIGVYTSTLHYLKAVQASGFDRGPQLVAQMKAMPVDDGITRNGRLRADGRMIHDLGFMEVKQPSESEYFADYFKLVAVVPGEVAYAPMTDACPYR